MYSWQWRQNAGKDLWTNMQEVFAECKKTTPLIRYSNTSAPLTRAPPCIWMSFIFCLLYIYNSMIVHVNFTSKYISEVPRFELPLPTIAAYCSYTRMFYITGQQSPVLSITRLFYIIPDSWNTKGSRTPFWGFPASFPLPVWSFFGCAFWLSPGWRKETDLELIFC